MASYIEFFGIKCTDDGWQAGWLTQMPGKPAIEDCSGFKTKSERFACGFFRFHLTMDTLPSD